MKFVVKFMARRTVVGVLVLVSLAVAAMLAATATARPKAKPPITIGFPIALSGWLQNFGGPGYNAAQIAVNDINRRGGVLGRKLRLVAADTKSDIQEGANAGIAVINKGAQFVVVTCDYNFGGPAARIAQQRNVIAISLCAGAPQFGVRGIGPLAYTMGTGTPTEGAAAAQWASSVKKWRTAYVLLDTTLEYNKQFLYYFKRYFQAAGGKIIGEDTYSSSDQSVASQISRLRGTSPKPDVILLSGFQPAMATVLRQLRAAGINTPILAPAAGDGDYWLSAVPGLSNYYYETGANIYGNDPRPAINRLQKLLVKRGLKLTSATFTDGYATIQALALAMQRAGSTNTAAVKKQLDRFRNVPLIDGPTTFTPAVHMPNGRTVTVMQVQNGKPSFVQLFTPKGVRF